MLEPVKERKHLAEQILILAPTGQDSTLMAEVLKKKGMSSEVLPSMSFLCARLDRECGIILISEEALTKDATSLLIPKLEEQSVWSDIPIIVLTKAGTDTGGIVKILNTFGLVGNISLIERPLRPITLESTVQGALRARKRQYQVRDLLIQQREATRLREEFISIASHELRTPLTSLKLMTQMNQRALNSPDPTLLTREKMSKLIEVTDNQVSRLTRLVEDMLDVSKIGIGKFTIRKAEVDYAELVVGSVERTSTELMNAGCKMHLDLPEKLIISLDQDRVEQVVTNLLTNIIRYAPGSSVNIQMYSEKQKVYLKIADNGPGIPEDRLTKIFDRFERATSSNNISGLGLGLYICRQIIEAHDGKINVESHLGEGTEFTIVLPGL